MLLAVARPPFDVGPLALVALVPLLWAWRGATPKRAIATGFVAGAAYYGILVSWAWYFGAVALAPFVAILALYWAAAGGLVACFERRGIRSPWLTAAVWVVVEAIVARFPLGGFSWGEVGYAFHALSPARALASVGGVPLVSFLAVATNAFILDVVGALRRPRRAALVLSVSGLLVVVLAAPAVATITWMHPTTTGRFHVALIQGNNLNRDLTQAEQDARYLPRSHFALANTLTGRYDLVVFPESSMDADPRTDAYLEGHLAAVASRLHSAVLANAVADAPDGRAVNLDLMYDTQGRLIGTYAKRHLVPYGEFVPFRHELQSVVTALKQIPRDFAPGHRLGLFDVKGHRVGTVICFESAFGRDVRPLVRHGAQLIVVSTNNRSYRRSANSAQHLALSQMRAAETGRPVVQAAISGISAVIDAHGNVSHTTHLFQRTVVDTTVTLTTGTTLYVRMGEWVTLASLLALAIALGIGFARRRDGSVDSTDVIDAPHTAGEPGHAPALTGDRA
ncbi:MAG: apolipoprotein N-acyltransferase [Actinomycetia bacterium]|nr:apolipoprotein N-acyltransferase [Actinomycetes bacterium]